jgi:ABC-2 type transport system ATP-binding protein
MSLISVKALKKSYDKFAAVKGIEFEIEEGEVFGILGPNGAGKTTTLEMMEGLRTIDSGSISIDGIDVKADPQAVKEIIGVQLQSSAFFDNLSLIELLHVFRDLYATRRDPYELLREVDLTAKAKSKVKDLSGGQKQRFSIAAALVNNPVVLFLDEPTTGLDPQARRNVWELVQDIKKRDKTIILTTHYMDEAELLCDRVAIMDGGKIIALDTPKNLIDQLLKRGFKKAAPVQKANLEDVFIDLTGKHIRD